MSRPWIGEPDEDKPKRGLAEATLDELWEVTQTRKAGRI